MSNPRMLVEHLEDVGNGVKLPVCGNNLLSTELVDFCELVDMDLNVMLDLGIDAVCHDALRGISFGSDELFSKRCLQMSGIITSMFKTYGGNLK